MRFLLADDHTLFRDALVHYIERAEPGSETLLAKDLDEAMEHLQRGETPDLVLLDMRMPGMNGLDGLRRMREAYPQIPVALMSGVAEPEDVRRAMDLGAAGFFPKTMSGKAMIRAMHMVISGERFLPLDQKSNQIMPSYHGEVPAPSSQAYPFRPNANDSGASLTPREQEVLSYLLKGASNKEIADKLNLQIVTVKLHIRGICRKLGAKNRTQAALRAREMGFNAAS